MSAEEKYRELLATLKSYTRVAVAFSGGVDSTLLLYAAREALGAENVFAFHGVSELLSREEEESGNRMLEELGVDQERSVQLQLHPLTWPEFVINSAYRCYFCKKRMYQRFLIESLSRECNILLDGSNVDDLKKDRPGFRAIRELGVKTPLLECGLTKKNIRHLSTAFHLSNHNKVSNSCLATRFSHGIAIEKEGLKRVERCEWFLLDNGFSGCRVQPIQENNVVLHLTRDDMGRLATSPLRNEITSFFKSEGFGRTLVDLDPRS